MARERAAMVVFVDLDPVPGGFHTPEDAQRKIESVLLTMFGHYNPVVLPFEE